VQVDPALTSVLAGRRQTRSPGRTAGLVHGELDVGAVVAEGLRLDSSVLGVFRAATRDLTLSEARITSGDLVFLSFTSANRDSALVSYADMFRLDRPFTRLPSVTASITAWPRLWRGSNRSRSVHWPPGSPTCGWSQTSRSPTSHSRKRLPPLLNSGSVPPSEPSLETLGLAAVPCHARLRVAAQE
jgi:hypothetical protein